MNSGQRRTVPSAASIESTLIIVSFSAGRAGLGLEPGLRPEQAAKQGLTARLSRITKGL